MVPANMDTMFRVILKSTVATYRSLRVWMLGGGELEAVSYNNWVRYQVFCCNLRLTGM